VKRFWQWVTVFGFAFLAVSLAIAPYLIYRGVKFGWWDDSLVAWQQVGIVCGGIGFILARGGLEALKRLER